MSGSLEGGGLGGLENGTESAGTWSLGCWVRGTEGLGSPVCGSLGAVRRLGKWQGQYLYQCWGKSWSSGNDVEAGVSGESESVAKVGQGA